jgi:hypothetical protein
MIFDHHFDLQNYSSIFRELLEEERLNVLGPGTPNNHVHAQLNSLDIHSAFAPSAVVNENMARACLAGVWLYHDFLDESHRISQEIPTPTGSYWHGILHRREGDFWNSKYWFRRVGEHPVFESLHREAARFVSENDLEQSAVFLTKQTAWDPFAFVDLCEAQANTQSPVEMLCRRIQQQEWDLLFDYCYRKAIGK